LKHGYIIVNTISINAHAVGLLIVVVIKIKIINNNKFHTADLLLIVLYRSEV